MKGPFEVSLKVYNTLGQKKEDFQSLEPGKVKMYCCGPTVYDFLHVGNFRGAVFYNLVRNWLEEIGYEVTYVYNFTDVDDKIINRANEEGRKSEEVAEQFIDEFWTDFNALELRKHDVNPRVTEHMDKIIEVVEKLIAEGKAYVVEGEVLYSVRSFDEYGKLSGRNVDDMLAGARVEVDPKKKDPMDFALWKPAKDGEPGWPSPWGSGRPGWHIECTAMIQAVLGDNIDIHGGGMDLIFPHHENEIAQAEGCTHGKYVKYWLHNNMFTFDGQKMSKSLGNIRTMRSFLKEYDPEIFKYMVLSVHYRSLADFSDASIERAVAGLGKFYSALNLAQQILSSSDLKPEGHQEFGKAVGEIEKDITEALNDDFNTSKVFASFFEVVKLFNTEVKRGQKVTAKVFGICEEFVCFMSKYAKMMSLFQQEPAKYLETLDSMLLRQNDLERSDIDDLVKQRKEARSAKDWAKSDEIRDRLKELKIAVQDLPDGSTYWEVEK